ncbi:acyl-CoA synthetase (AMP-forming)/AMP-acid ligase II [Rhizobium sp. BK181]|uniref:class I adenylate-forming enzyme family protein n=1 Tax=Rhizobium sp. BK181 TaxID=2587072 RepID=UPI001612C29E|nr:AMP-binding protein [Rhizobium sp. BK181]MBB3318868.1 acyl-CoA synthetase (AMP-forming)/AMP-acid ligase II [Rhizobium sp. BK181]
MLTFGELIRRNGLYWGHKDAFVEADRRRSWHEFHSRTDALGFATRRLGATAGDRVAILSADCIEVAETFGACMKIGAVRVGLNPRLTQPEIAALVADCSPTVIFVHRDYLDQAEKAAFAMPAGRGEAHIIEFGSPASEYERLIAAESDQPELVQTPHPTAMIAYTTGSTGLPKGAVYPHGAFLQSILYTAMLEGIDPSTRWLHTMPAAGVPLMHMVRNLFHAAATVIVGPWSAEQALFLIGREHTTNVVLVPTMLNSLLESSMLECTDMSSMRLFGYGASPLPPKTIKKAMKAFSRPFLQMFGTTELMGMSMMLFPSDHELGITTRPEILASAGKPLPFVDVKVVDGDGRSLPPGETGELIVRSDTQFSGYWNAPEKNAEVIKDGWIYTGDLASRDEAGYVYLSDRAKFRIRSGGYDVFPTEVENALAEHPAVSEVAVIGLPDERYGERIHAVVTTVPGKAVTSDELREFCRNKIAAFKVPKCIDIWTEIPKGPTGKIQKRAIIEHFTSEAASRQASSDDKS